MYYEINETAARRAKEANSHYDYHPGSATAEYRSTVDKAVELAEAHKKRVDPMYHGEIDRLLDKYARKLADNMNARFSIDARVPSILITGGSNFPVRKKEKQNAAREKNHQEWQYIQGLLDKIQSTGMGGISADDPQVIPKLEAKLAALEKDQEDMKRINAYYKKHKSLDGCPDLSPDIVNSIKAEMARSWRQDPRPFESYSLTNNNANIKRTRERLEGLKKTKENPPDGWVFAGGEVVANTDDNRLQIFFEEKPDADLRTALKSRAFKWAPSVGAWQRQLTKNAIYDAKQIEAIRPQAVG